jgi:hypothetical protein
MGPATRLDGVRVSQADSAEADSAATAARDAAPDDSGLEGSRGGHGVSWGELRVALRLSVVCAVTAALLAVPAGATEFLVDDQIWAALGEGVEWSGAFKNTERMQRREPLTVDFDCSTPQRRVQRVLASAWGQAILLLFQPVCYVAYLGASLRVRCLTLGSSVLTLAAVMAGFMASGNNAFLDYSTVLGFALLVVALRLLSPRGSRMRIPAQAMKQALVITVGNALIMHVIPEKTVRARHSYVR